MVTHEPSTGDTAPLRHEPPRSAVDHRGDSTTSSEGLDGVFAALRHSRRRHLLSVLSHREGEQPLDRLATDVVARETDQSPEQVTAAARRDCRVALHHVHLPKLAALDVVDYHYDGEPTVQPGDMDRVQAVLEHVDDGPAAGDASLLQRDGA